MIECKCGCGENLTYFPHYKYKGWAKFIHGHQTRGKFNAMWQGDNVGKTALHTWIHKYKPKPELCEDCKNNEPYDLANISQEYKRDISDFEWLCRKCHMIKDGRLKALEKTQFKPKELIES